MSTFPLRLPDDREKQAAVQAEAAVVSLNQYMTTAVAAHGARAVRGRAKEILARAGVGNASRKDDEFPRSSIGVMVE